MERGGAWPPSEGKKKWSIGKLFRRKKKDSDSEASSASTDEHSQKNSAKRKKSDKKKRSSVSRPNFDHADLSDKRSQSVTKFPKKEYFDEGVLSDPSAGFVGYIGRGLPRSPLDQSRHRSKDSLYKLATASSGSQDGSLRKGRKGRIKARVEAMRSSKNDSSSDDESQKSTSSSVFKFRSDDSLANHSKEGSVSKRSRSARNDRLIKRLSRDDESQLNREADLMQRGYSRSEAELLALKQRVLSTPQINGNSDKKHEEPDYSEPMKVLQSMPYDTKKSYSGSHLAGHTNLAHSQGKNVVTGRHYPALSASNSSVYSYPAGIIHFNAQVNDESIKYSVPYNVNNQNRTDIPQSFRRSASVEQNNNDSENVMVIKLPLGSVPKKEAAAPPPPPPRDPQRKVPTPVSYMYDNTRPMSYAFDSGARRYSQNYVNSESFGINSNPQNIYENAAPIDKNTGLSWGKRPISTSEDHIAMQQQQYYNASTPLQNNQPKRPSSVSAEVIRPEVYNRYLARPQINNSYGHAKRDPARRHTQENANPEFMYYADMTPRSRRPIQIAPTDPTGKNNILTPTEPKPQAKNASDFWRKMDSQEVQRRRIYGHNRTLSDQSVSGLNTHQNHPLNVRNSSITSNIATRPNIVNGNRGVISNKAQENYFKNNGLLANRHGPTDKTTRIGNKENEEICYSNIDIIPMDDIRHKKQTGKYSEDEFSGSRRKSSNLEDALSELEAIYNSLGLGDEDLLDRADRQEMLAPKTAESLPYSSKDNFFRFPSLDDSNNEMNRRGSLSTKLSVIPDKVHDDMAYRRMNPNERPKSKDVGKLTSQVSYMLASPVLADDQGSKIILDGESSEPDVLLDDVVFRNIRQANNYLKIEDPQLPFGIPIGPITPAPNSDYLHAVPDSKRRSRFIPQESPDIVSDDLAYRSLRKDSKNPSPVNKENPTCIFNNTSDNTNLSRPSKIFDNHVIKKKRAVRSLSANIFTLVQREIDDALDLCKNPSIEKAQSIPDLPEAVLEFGKSGKLPDNFKSSQQLLNESKSEIKLKANTVPEYKTTDLPTSNLRSVNGKERVNKPDEFSKNYSINYLNSSASRLSNSNQIRNELDTMAQEAKETSAKLVIALEELQNEKLSRFLPENKEKNDIKPVAKKDDKQNDITSSSSALQKYLYPESEINIQPSKVNETKASISRQLSQSPTMKVKGTIPPHIKEKMEEFSRSNKNEDPSNDFMATINKLKSSGDQKAEPKPALNTGRNTEDSLIAISNQLKIVGCQLKNNTEKPNMFQEESMRLKYLANKCEIDLNENYSPQTHNKLGNTTVHSTAKYSFLNSDGNSFPKPTCISPKIVSSQSKIDIINNMQSFDDLRKGISELLDGIGQVNEKLQFPQPTPQHQQKIEIKTTAEHHSKDSSLDESSLEDTSKSRENRASPEYNSSEELAMIFNIPDEQKQPSTSKANNAEGKTESHLELNSPRLVKTANQNLRKLSLEELDTNVTVSPKPQVIEATRPQALEHTRPLALEPARPQALEPIRPQAMEPAKSQMMDQSAEVSTSQEVPWRRNRRLSSTDNANKGNIQAHEVQRGARRQSPDPDPPSKNINSGSCSAFRPVKPRRFQTVAPSSASKIIKDRPFFEDIKIIARGFGEIIEFPDRVSDLFPSAASLVLDDRIVNTSGEMGGDEGKMEGMRKYKEERKVQRKRQSLQSRAEASTRPQRVQSKRLTVSTFEPPSETNPPERNTSSSSETSVSSWVRTTRASRLRAPAFAADSSTSKSQERKLPDAKSQTRSKVGSVQSATNLVPSVSDLIPSAASLVLDDRIMNTSGAMGGDAGKMEGMRRYKEERRKRPSLQSRAAASTRPQRVQSRRLTASILEPPLETNPPERKTSSSSETSVSSWVRTTRASRVPSVSDLIPSAASLDVSGVSSKVSGNSIFMDSSNDSVRTLSVSASGNGVQSVSDVIAGEGEAVISLCDSLSDKMTVSSSGVSSRGNSRTRSPLLAAPVGPPSQNGPTFKQLNRPAQSKDPKGNIQDHKVQRGARHQSSDPDPPSKNINQTNPPERNTSSSPGTSVSSMVRTTKASRLRAAASAADSLTSKSQERMLPDAMSQTRSKVGSVQSVTNLVPSVSDLIPSAASLVLDVSGLSSKVSGNSIFVDSSNDSVRALSDSASGNGVQSVSDVIAGEVEAVISLCDSLSDKVTVSSSGVSSRGNSRTRRPLLASPVGPPSQNSPTFKQPTRPAQSKDPKDETVTRRGHLSPASNGVKSENDLLKDITPAKKSISPCSLSRTSAVAVNRRTSPRSYASARSSSHSPLSSPSAIKIQQNRRSLEISAKIPSRTSPGTSSTRSSSTEKIQKAFPDASSSVNSKSSDTRKICDKRTKSSEDNSTENSSPKAATVDAEQSRIKKRLNSRISDIRKYNGGCKKEKDLRPRKDEEVSKMTPGIKEDVLQNNLTSPVNVDNKTSSNTSSVDSHISKIDKSRSANARLSSRMDALAALTKETLAKVDRLSKKNKTPQEKDESCASTVADSSSKLKISRQLRTPPEVTKNRVESIRNYSGQSTSRAVSERLSDIDAVTQHLIDFERKNSNNVINDQYVSLRKHNEPSLSLLSYTPVSILKRKSSQDEHGLMGLSNGTVATPPVTFSPSVVDRIPSKSRRHGQGILKKRRSLDESQVNRHRSCSPEVVFADDYNLDNSRPILKTQRRSSLEEVIRGRSPDGIQGILKRKCSRDGELLLEDQSLESPEPQGILKRKSNSSSSSSTTSSHVSIAQAVILAAAGGAEIVDDKDSVRPILKKKSFSEERPCFDTSNGDIPRPILKKKSLTECDDNDHDRPKKTILKSARKIPQEDGNTSSFDLSEDDRNSRRSSMLKHRTPDGSETESSYRPILKQRGSSQSREHSQSPRPRLSFCSDDERAPQFADDANTTGQHFVNPSFSLLRRLEANNSSRSSEDNDSSRPSKFEAGRLQSPSKLKEFLDSETSLQNQQHFPSVVLRRRDLRPKVVERSKSLASNFSAELDQILKFRKSLVDDSCLEDLNDAVSTRDPSPVAERPPPPKTAQRFPSIAERIQCMEKYLGKEPSGPTNATGAVPKRHPRQSARYKTQPVTVDELQNISRLEDGQFQRLAGASSSSVFPAVDYSSPSFGSLETSLGRNLPQDLPETSSRNEVSTSAEASALSPDHHPTWINSKFQNYARSPGYGTASGPSSFDFVTSSQDHRRYPDSDSLRSPVRVKAFENVTASAGSPEYRPVSSDFEDRSPDRVKSSDTSESVPHLPHRPNFETPSDTPLSPELGNNFADFDGALQTTNCGNSTFVEHFDELVHWPQHHTFRNSTNGCHNLTPDSFKNRSFPSGRNSLTNGHLDKVILSNSFEDPKDSPTTREFNRIYREASKIPDKVILSNSFEDPKDSPTTTQFNTIFREASKNLDKVILSNSFEDPKDSPTTKLSLEHGLLNGIDSLDQFSDPPATVSGTFEPALSFGEYVPPRRLDARVDDQVQVKVERPRSLFHRETSYQREATLQELDQLEVELEDVRAALDGDSRALCSVDADHWSLNVSVDSGVFNRMSSGDSGPLSAEELSLPQDFSKQPDIVKDSQPQPGKLASPSNDSEKSKYQPETLRNQTDLQKLNLEQETNSNLETMGVNCVKSPKEKPPTGALASPEQKAEHVGAQGDKEKEESPEPVDSPQQLFGLMKSNSVSARASMWQQLQTQTNQAAVRPVMRHSRSKAKDGASLLDRFKTQPITFGEVSDASNEVATNPLNQSRSSFNLSLEQDEDAKLDENDPAKLTLAEKMKLFGAKLPTRPPMGNNNKKPRSARFQTMPVLASQVDDAKQRNLDLNSSKADVLSPRSKIMKLSLPGKEQVHPEKKPEVEAETDTKMKLPMEDANRKEIGMNFRIAQNKLAEQASRMLTSEVKGILKSRSGAIPLLPSAVAAEPKQPEQKPSPGESVKKTNMIPILPKAKSDVDKSEEKPALTKGESSEGLKDEGIDSSSDDESPSGSIHSSDESCSSSESSEESEVDEPEVVHQKSKSPEPHNVKPSQLLKNSRTESDIARVAKDNSNKTDGRIKLPCMDEMKAREIMQRCMLKTDKDTSLKTRVPIVTQKKISPDKTRLNPLDPTAIRMRNLKNGNFAPGKNLDMNNRTVFNTNRINANNAAKVLVESADVFKMNEQECLKPWARKLIPPVSKSQSVHVFNSALANRLRNRREERAEGEGSESDGESSGGQEVRRIINKRRPFRSPPSAASQPAPHEDPISSGLVAGLRRSATQPMAAQALPQHRSGSIAERLAALQQSGNNEWRKRVARVSPDQDVITATKNRINETLSQQVEEQRLAAQLDPTDLASDLLISDRRNKLENSAQGWKKRVGPNDASLFSVAGRMGKDAPSLPSPLADLPLAPALITTAQDKKMPQANRFRSRRADGNIMSMGLMKSATSAAVSQPASPKRPGPGDFKRSISVSGVDEMAAPNAADTMTKSEGGAVNGSQAAGPSVAVPRADDETFTSFFTSASQTVVDSPNSTFIPYNNNNNEQIAEDIDLDAIDSGTRHLLSQTGINRVRATRKTGPGSRNPLRALALRTDLRQEYTEPPNSGVADKEAARLKRDKIAVNTPLAVEALAGLASREDFTAIHLKKTGQSPPSGGGHYTEAGAPLLLLIHVKGRRRVQVRLVDPIADSVNSGDCFVLVTPDQVFNYNGYYSNVIERSRASDIALHIHTTKDLGCTNSTCVINLDEQIKHRSPRQWKQFWALLGVDDEETEYTPTPAGNADEDEIFESGIISTNMCYEVIDDELVPIQEYWGQTPKIAMLDPSKILVFDFGSELYVWNGKNTILENRRRAFQLAQELWDEGFDYKDCHICPLSIHEVLGARGEFKEISRKDSTRPAWAMITKVTQHMETILFKDKFLDWPDFSRVIKVKEEEDSFKGAAEIKPCNVEVMWNREYEDPSLILEGSHVGRGTHYFDKETMKHFEVKTKSVTKWVIQEYDYLKIEPEDLNEFYSGDSYIVRWEYQITVTGRELNGKPSKHNQTGRDRCAYFCWQGKDATANEKGAAALLTVELDHEKGPQVRVTQSCEPPAFLNLFKGSLIIHQGKKGSEKSKNKLYAVRGNIESESHLVQVACSMRQLRSRSSMIVVDSENGQIYVWHGVKSLKHTRSIAIEAAKKMASKKHVDLFDSTIADVKVTEVKEGDEPKSVIDILGGNNRELYHSLVSKQNKTEEEEKPTTPRLFHFTDLSGQFDAIEVLSPLRHESLVTAYPFSQQELYTASQPGLFLLDCGDRLWLWQGWWPQREDFESTETGSGTLRWQVCRRAAMETVLEYWKLSRPSLPTPRAFLAVAGLEPLPFTNMFDDWRDLDDVTELNIAYGHKVGEGELSVSVELCRLSRTSFPLAVLRQRPLPEAVDPAHIERYLIPDEFQEVFNMPKEEFYELPAWKQANTKKELGLF